MNHHKDRSIQTGRHQETRPWSLRLRRPAHAQQIGKNSQQQHRDQQGHDRQEIDKFPWFLGQHGFRLYRLGVRDEGKSGSWLVCGASRSCRFVGARLSGRFSVNEPTRLEFSESCGRSDSEAASTPRSDAENLWMHGFVGGKFAVGCGGLVVGCGLAPDRRFICNPQLTVDLCSLPAFRQWLS